MASLFVMISLLRYFLIIGKQGTKDTWCQPLECELSLSQTPIRSLWSINLYCTRLNPSLGDILGGGV
jgi:hypothetical protein